MANTGETSEVHIRKTPRFGTAMGADARRLGEKVMGEWIPFREGEYIVERAFLFAPDASAVLLEDAVISVFAGPSGERRMEGTCRVRNILLVRLLDDHDVIDLALDFGEEFTYVLRDPRLRSGKVFSPDVQSHLQFVPRTPWQRVSPEKFEALWSGLRFLS